VQRFVEVPEYYETIKEVPVNIMVQKEILVDKYVDVQVE